MANDDRAGRDDGGSANEDRVVPLRQRGARPRPNGPAGDRNKLPSLSERDEPGDTDDYRRRMLANAVGLALIVGLIAAGIWLANAIADMRRNQDCVLSGRRNCAPIETPQGAR